MAQSEIQSLDTIQYKSKIKFFFLPLLILFVFLFSFLRFFPVSDKVGSIVKSALNSGQCRADFDKIDFNFLLPKLVISNITLPPQCLGQTSGEPLQLDYVHVNFQLINFSPLGLPFRIDTVMNGQKVSFYVVQGFGERMIRIKDQSFSLAKLAPMIDKNIKLSGDVVIDLNLKVTHSNAIKNLNLKAQSKNLNFPSQSIQGFTTPNLKLNNLSLEAFAENSNRINIDQFIIGDTESPVRASFKGRVDIQEKAIPFSPVNLSGEVAFSEGMKQSLPLIDMLFQSFTQKDGFYQIKLGGTLGAIKPSSL